MLGLNLLLIGIGGFIGAPARALADRAVSDRRESALPLGTFAVNLSGSLLLGLLTGLAIGGHLPVDLRQLAGTGFCGAFTTFSTWSFETLRLIEEGRYAHALANALLSLLLGVGAALAGIAVGLSA